MVLSSRLEIYRREGKRERGEERERGE